jgi:thiol-disulfide isomerase/thioredoxin
MQSATDTRFTLPNLGQAPELTGLSEWINAAPTTLAEQRGNPVLVHFWTFGCINCVHVQPYVKAWHEQYAKGGLVVLGIHTPELAFERDPANVRAAVTRFGIEHPVALDPDFATWNAYGNRYWPAFYFVDRLGRIRHRHFGEGQYQNSEAVIAALLAEPAV